MASLLAQPHQLAACQSQHFSHRQACWSRRSIRLGVKLVPRASADDAAASSTAQADGLPASPLFSPQFASVFQQTLQRQGKDALLRNAKPAEERKQSSAEEVLGVAMQRARRNVMILEDLKKQVSAAIEREEAQFQRMDFALKRATNEAAYIRTLQKLLEEEKAQSQELRDQLAKLE